MEILAWVYLHFKIWVVPYYEQEARPSTLNMLPAGHVLQIHKFLLQRNNSPFQGKSKTYLNKQQKAAVSISWLRKGKTNSLSSTSAQSFSHLSLWAQEQTHGHTAKCLPWRCDVSSCRRLSWSSQPCYRGQFPCPSPARINKQAPRCSETAAVDFSPYHSRNVTNTTIT